ncbi:pectin acetylesterase-family hydrolase [Trujillonella endophytica]|uniref:Pectinacetylesterase n=1 Tax=Trujillonella endophytica TaxID=673521 RepID=A0A1H8T5B7_9ACTN|nr:pectin acetylesterase-family hydrolase [Trujillella endophytica]SEO86299.1 Pectinacetylesterase [Trujillella endophytica]
MFRRSLLTPVVAALALSGLAACSDDDSGSDSADGDGSASSSAAETEAGQAEEITWEKVTAPAECQCSDASEYHYWIHQGDTDRVVFFLEGGGACFSAETCAPGESATYSTSLADDSPDGPGANGSVVDGGLLDLDNPDNPLAGASVVYVPYCTGDLHLGTTSHDYGNGVVVQHKGSVNATTALDTLAEEFPDASEVIVLGQSAGSASAALYGGLAADRFPDAQVTVLADASAAYPGDEALTTVVGGLWGIAAGLPDWPEAAGDPPTAWSLPGLFVQTAEHVPGIRLATINTADDEVQRRFADLIGFSGTPLVELIDGNTAQIESAGVELDTWVGAGTTHVVTARDELYEAEVGGTLLIDWITDVVNGEDVEDVHV